MTVTAQRPVYVSEWELHAGADLSNPRVSAVRLLSRPFPRARSRFEQLAHLSDPLPSDELSLLIDVLPQPEAEVEPPQRRRKRMRPTETEEVPLEVSFSRFVLLLGSIQSL